MAFFKVNNSMVGNAIRIVHVEFYLYVRYLLRQIRILERTILYAERDMVGWYLLFIILAFHITGERQFAGCLYILEIALINARHQRQDVFEVVGWRGELHVHDH